MASISVYLANKLLDHLFGGSDYTPPATVYCALFIVLPLPDGTGGVEVSGGSYVRKSMTNNATNFPAAAGSTKTNGTAIAFVTPTADWGGTVGAAWYDASSGGNLLTYGPWSSGTRTILNGNPFTIDPGSMVLTDFGSGSSIISTYLADGLSDLVFSQTAFTRPGSLYFASFTSMPNIGGTGGVEPSTGSYTRVTFTNNSSNFPAATAQVKANAAAITWPTATGNWGLQIGTGIFDASSGGNYWMGVPFGTAQTINGTTLTLLSLPTNAFTASLV